MLVRPGQKTLFRTINQTRILFRQHLVTEPEPVHRAGPEIFDDHVGIFCKAQRDVAPFFGLQINAQTALIAVVHGEVAGPGTGQVPRRVACDRFDLDHIGTHIGEDHAGRRPHDHVGELENLNIVQG